ncbi:GTP-binding protein [Rhodanobacter sp. FDAARGOS 1247]|uniref:GTP-binding protein n=1 Tax=Rhodanobacter sp. FDAARGOS 1247 TaxID=2778082 RepID=UPI00194DC587|nr:GTP-binding protein [Rhodanobacter sp. FDAARGOS 1247]QRP63303.1 GTP-binding protein [Rhodanobacter sp. FDAARGOS 1247]
MPNDSLWRRLRGWVGSGRAERATTPPVRANAGSAQVADSLRALLDDPGIPASVRSELAADFSRIEQMLDKLQRGELHVAVFGRVSAGKSALGNALLGREAFTVGVLHGTTTDAEHALLDEAQHDGLVLIDTPGINELDGEAREKLAFEVAEVSDLVIFVCDGDLTREELDALKNLAATQRPLLLALNKADRYGRDELDGLLEHLRLRVAGLVRADDVLAVAAHPAPQRVVEVDARGHEQQREQARTPDVAALRERLLAIAAREGKTLSAINAGLYAGRLTDQVSARIAETRKAVAAKLIHHYCIAKGVAVALNPIPVADLLAAAGLDAAMVVQLSRVYGLPLTRAESGRLVAVISAQLAALMGAIWGMQLVASALKGVSAGLSVVVTAAAQGALGWYATVLIGRAAERYLVGGKSWGEAGAKRAVADIVASLDRDSILREAREEILKRLKSRRG